MQLHFKDKNKEKGGRKRINFKETDQFFGFGQKLLPMTTLKATKTGNCRIRSQSTSNTGNYVTTVPMADTTAISSAVVNLIKALQY